MTRPEFKCKNRKTIHLLGLLIIIGFGCASNPKDIKPSYVSTLRYKKYTCEFYESLDIDKKCDEFYEVLCNLNIKTSTSLLQQYLICHLDNPEGAITNIKEIKKMYEASKVNNFETAEAGLYN